MKEAGRGGVTEAQVLRLPLPDGLPQSARSKAWIPQSGRAPTSELDSHASSLETIGENVTSTPAEGKPSPTSESAEPHLLGGELSRVGGSALRLKMAGVHHDTHVAVEIA
jgi:hypothetical protein